MVEQKPPPGANEGIFDRFLNGLTNNRFGDIARGVEYNQNTLAQSKYDFNQLVFPNNIGQSDMGHYMVININVPVKRSGEAGAAGEMRSAYSGGLFGDVLPDYSKVDVLRFGKLNSNQVFPGSAQREKFSIPRYTRRIAQSIALHMPNQVNYVTQNAYEEISLTALAGSIGGGAIQAVTAGIGAGAGGPLGLAVGTAVGGWLAGAGGQLSDKNSLLQTGARIAGHPINPRIEVLYSNTALRTFIFELMLGPTTPEESVNIERIIGALRFHAAPEIEPNYGLTFIPPAEFDITFFNKGQENIHIPRINTCILQTIDVDYSPAGGLFSTFSNGHPVAIRLSLKFSEVEILHKRRIVEGF